MTELAFSTRKTLKRRGRACGQEVSECNGHPRIRNAISPSLRKLTSLLDTTRKRIRTSKISKLAPVQKTRFASLEDGAVLESFKCRVNERKKIKASKSSSRMKLSSDNDYFAIFEF